MNTVLNSNPLLACTVINVTASSVSTLTLLVLSISATFSKKSLRFVKELATDRNSLIFSILDKLSSVPSSNHCRYFVLSITSSISSIVASVSLISTQCLNGSFVLFSISSRFQPSLFKFSILFLPIPLGGTLITLSHETVSLGLYITLKNAIMSLTSFRE